MLVIALIVYEKPALVKISGKGKQEPVIRIDPAHLEYMALAHDERMRVCKMAALLRLACGMAEACDGYKNFSIEIGEDGVVLEFIENTGKSFDPKTIQKASDLFTYVFSRVLTIS